MTTHPFELELHGPSGSGKSTFIDFIIKACNQGEEWTTESIPFPPSGCRHHLIITHKKQPIPETKGGEPKARGKLNNNLNKEHKKDD